jgi:hypothetical protein
MEKQSVLGSFFNDKRLFVASTYPSIFSKEDVITLLNITEKEIEAVMNSSNSPSKETFIDFAEELKDSIADCIDNFDFDNDYDVQLNYDRRIEVEFDSSSLNRELCNLIDSSVEDLFTKTA